MAEAASHKQNHRLKGKMQPPREKSFEIPESIIALVLSHTTPRDVARLALVNRAFYEASRTDVVWERMLPAQYPRILKLSSVPICVTFKRELYDQLCDHILIGDGSEGVWIDRPTGAACHSFSARSLAVTWGSTAEYWEWSPKPGARFEEVAHLKMVCWLELSGHWKINLPPGAYTVSWRLQLDSDAFGWDKEPVRFCLSTEDGRVTQSSCYLVDMEGHEHSSNSDESEEDDEQQQQPTMVAKARAVDHHWTEYDVGQVKVEEEDEDLGEVQLFFSMQEIASGTWKGGLFIDGIVIQPSNLI